MSITFYDRSGVPVAYSDDGTHVFLYSGDPVAYLEDEAMYAYRGELLGWFEEGWLRDKDGHCVAFSDHAAGGPPHAVSGRRPYPAMKQAIPVAQRRDPRSLRPIHSNVWSTLSALEFFSHLQHRWPGGLGAGGAH
jgi:hypothetical protein